MAKRKNKKSRRSYAANPAKKSRRRSYRSNPSRPVSRRRRSYRSNPSGIVKDIGMLLGGAVAGAIVGPKIVSKLPVSPMIQNIGLAAAGAAAAYFGRNNKALVGLGAGLAVSGVRNMLLSAVPTLAGENELTQDEQAQLLSVPSEQENQFGSEFNGAFSGTFAGDMNSAPM